MITKTDKQDIRDLLYEDFTAYLKGCGEQGFRAAQVFDWIYKKGVRDFDAMANLPDSLKKRLKEDFTFSSYKVVTEATSDDKTKKFLFEFNDKEKVEAVLIPKPNRATVCISTQAGCKFGCRFCASGIGGWNRDLTCAEIISQVLFAKENSKQRPLSHIVFMGTGEPLDNYRNVIKAIRLINSPKGINIGARRITVSTCGLVPQIKEFAQEGLQIELAVSLHGADDESRNVLMPVNKKYPVKDLIATCREYTKKTKRQITFEYILIKDVTCTQKAARQLGQILKGMLCKINLIPYNKVNEFDHDTPSRAEMFDFKNKLGEYGILATIRIPRGRDVNAACGQLRHTAMPYSKK